MEKGDRTQDSKGVGGKGMKGIGNEELNKAWEVWWKEWLLNNKITQEEFNSTKDVEGFFKTLTLEKVRLNLLGAFRGGCKSAFVDIMTQAMEADMNDIGEEDV